MPKYDNLSEELQERIREDRKKHWVNPFAFRDEEAGGTFAVVYCRNDGDYGLIEDEQ